MKNSDKPDYGQAKKRKRKIDSQAINNSHKESAQIDTSPDINAKSSKDLKKLKEELLRHRRSKRTPISISLLSFADFLSKTDQARQTFVRGLKLRTNNPGGRDYWIKLKYSIRQFHKGKINFEEFQDLPNQVTTDLKPNFQRVVQDYLSFINGKSFRWFKPLASVWIQGNFGVKIKPDLGLIYEDNNILLMLYIRNEQLSKKKVTAMITLMKNCLLDNEKAYKYWLYDVQERKLHTDLDIDEGMLPVLRMEALEFENIWNRI